MTTTRTAAAFLLLASALAPRAHAQAPVLPSLEAANGALAAVADAPAEEAPDALASDMADGRRTRGFVQHRVLHFTFDDGPREETTRAILDHLDHYGMKATFFVVGRQLAGPHHRAQRALLREMAARGHTIGTHTWDHSNLTGLTDEEIAAQLDQSEAAFEETFGARPWLIRPPYGARTARVDALLASRHYTSVLWNISSYDTMTRDPEEMLARFRAQLDQQERHPRGPGGIVLLHDTHEHTVEAFPLFVEELRARNCALLEQEGEELWDVANDPRIFFQASTADGRMATSVRLDDEAIAARQAIVRAQAEAYCAR